MQVKDAEHPLRHKMFPSNAWMKLTDFNVLTSCPKDDLGLHPWFLVLYCEHIIPTMVHGYTLVLQRPDLIWHRTLRPIGTAAGCYKRYDEDIPLDLIFFSPFEELRLRTARIMESKGINRVD